MAATCFNDFSYVIFTLLYIVSIYFTYLPYTEIIGFSILFVINAAFTLFFIGQTQSPSFIPLYQIPYIGNVSIAAIGISLIFHFVSFIFIIMMITTLQAKYTKVSGTPLQITGKNKSQMNTFKMNMVIVFSLIFIELMIILNINKVSSGISTGMLILISATIVGLSSWQVAISNEFSKLQYRDLVGR